MKTKMLLLLVAMAVGSTLSATTITVTNANASGAGSLTQAFTDAVAGDMINFNFDGTELSFTDVVTMKSITIDGLNAFNNQKLVLKQSTASKGFSLSQVELLQRSQILFLMEQVFWEIQP